VSDHERFSALKRITVKRGATKAEAATAKHLAAELEKKIGKRPRRTRAKGRRAALPEPLDARKRRIWGLRIDEAIAWAERLGVPFLIALYCAPTVVIGICLLTGHNITVDQIEALFLIKYGVLAALAVQAAIISFAFWWLLAEPGTRGRQAVTFAFHVAPLIVFITLWLVIAGQIDRVTGYSFAAGLASCVAFYLVGDAWYRWVHPVVSRKLGMAL
jgi:hypothetical protein